MKKVIMLAAVAAALASCQSKANKVAEAQTDSPALTMTPVTEPTEVYEVYKGTLPAADGPGIDYVLTLNAETDGADTVYTLDMTYLDAEGGGRNKTITSKGKQETVRKTVDKKPVTAVKLTPENGEAPMYFAMVNDTTLRMVNDSLQEAVGELNYDIIKVKR